MDMNGILQKIMQITKSDCYMTVYVGAKFQTEHDKWTNIWINKLKIPFCLFLD